MREALIKRLMIRLGNLDDEIYSLFIILYKLELVLQDIEKQEKNRDDLSLRFIDSRLTRHHAVKLKIYSLRPEEKNLQPYFEKTIPDALLEKWVTCSATELEQSLNDRCDEKSAQLKETENKLKKIHARRAKNKLAWSLLTFKKQVPPILKASFIGILANLFGEAHYWSTKCISTGQLARYFFMFCGAALGAFATYKNGFYPSLKALFLIYACQNYAKKYNAMRRTDDHYARVLEPPKYILKPSVAARMIMFLVHAIGGFLRKDRISLLASMAGFFSSILFVKGMTSWNKNLQASQVNPSDSATLLQQKNRLYLLSVCGFYLFGYLPAVYLSQKYGLAVFCGEAARFSKAVLSSEGAIDVNVQRSSFYYLSPSFWWSNTITTTGTWVSAAGDHLQQACLCSSNEAMPFICEPAMNQTQY